LEDATFDSADDFSGILSGFQQQAKDVPQVRV
jgi:hypothetical protein